MILSIIIPMFKVEQYIYKCLDSCYKQDVSTSEYEILCINDGSPDNSGEKARAYSLRYDNIRVIDRENGGLSAARNTGLANAKGDFVFFLDSDDWIAENCLGRIFKLLEEEKPDILGICAANVYDGKAVRRFSHHGKPSMTGIEALRGRLSPCAPFSIVRKSLLDAKNLRFFEGIYHEDSEFTPRLYYYAKKVAFIDDVIYYVYQNPESITRKTNPKRTCDIIDVVCPHLHSFSEKVENESKQVFDNRISGDLNTALSQCKDYSKEEADTIKTLLFKNRYLFTHLKKSSYLKFKIEGYLFALFPKHVINIYNLMQFFNYENRKRNRPV